MKNSRKKLFTTLIALCMSVMLIFTAVGCGDTGTGGGDDNNNSDGKNLRANHYSVIGTTEYDLVRDGLTDYVIVYDSDKDGVGITDLTVNELRTFFEQATGIYLAASSDKEVTYSASSKFIVLGNNDVTAAAEVVTADDVKDLTQTAFIIKNKGASVFLIGGDIYGTLNAVYEFLRKQLHWECYATDEIAIDTGVRNAKLLDFDVKEIPDITWRSTGQTELRYNTMLARRLNINPQSDFIITMGGAFYHNWLGTVPPATHAAAHSNWYNSTQTQLCLTRDKEGLGDFVVGEIKKTITANPYAYAVGFTQEDDAGWCDCASCLQCKETYGTDSASQILFMNYVWDELEPWLNENYPEKDFYIYMFAYQKNTEAPASYNTATGKWEPNAPEMVLRDHIYVQYAPIYAAGYHSYGTFENKLYDDTMNAWLAITDNIMFWSYSFYYKELSFPYFDFADLTETHKYLAQHKVVYLFDEEGPGAIGKDWQRLKAYVKSKIAWDYEADASAYIDDWFVNYFKAAAPAMKQLFDEYSTHYTTIIEENGLRGQGGQCDINKAEYWPKGLMDGWLRLLDKAYDDIEFLKTADPEMYSKLEYRICLESLEYRYLSELFYGTSIYKGNGNTLAEDAARYGFEL